MSLESIGRLVQEYKEIAINAFHHREQALSTAQKQATECMAYAQEQASNALNNPGGAFTATAKKANDFVTAHAKEIFIAAAVFTVFLSPAAFIGGWAVGYGVGIINASKTLSPIKNSQAIVAALAAIGTVFRVCGSLSLLAQVSPFVIGVMTGYEVHEKMSNKNSAYS